MKYVYGFVALIVILWVTIAFKYSRMYVQDSSITATKGIFFKKTLNLEEYRNVSSGNDVWGQYSKYSRSDRHTETLTIYCKEYCK